MNFEVKNLKGNNPVEKRDNEIPSLEKIKKDARAKGEYIVTVSGDEKGLTAIARKFNMSLTDFKNMTGLTKDALEKNQVIKNVPHAKIPDGKGLKYLAEQNGMSVDELLALNGLPKNYKPSKGEHFYVYPKKQGVEKASKPEPKPQPKPENDNSVPKASEAAPVDKPVVPKKEVTPKEIAEQIREAVCNNTGAVGKEDFAQAFLKINDKNAKEVIKEYEALPKNDETLINAICSEIKSSSELRKDAVMTVYDNLAKQTKSSNPLKRQEFKAELEKEFGKPWYKGMVNTDNMDKMIAEMIDGEEKTPEVTVKKSGNSSTSSSIPNETLKSTNGGNSKDITSNTLTTIKGSDGNYATAGQLKRWAINSAKKDKGFSKVDNPYIVRPLPNYNTETKKIEAVTELQKPTGKGNLNNKVVILNSGHGGYQQSNGSFDPGTVLSVKNAEGKEMPIEEWRVAQSFVDKLSDELRSRGATVVFVSGAVKNGGMAKQHYLENMLAGKKGADDVREVIKDSKKSDMLFLSVHVESVKENPKDKKCTVRYTKGVDKKLSDNINKHLKKGFPQLTPKVEHDNLYVNNATKGISSSLLEIGNIANENITNSLLSTYDQKKYMKCVADAIEETLIK